MTGKTQANRPVHRKGIPGTNWTIWHKFMTRHALTAPDFSQSSLMPLQNTASLAGAMALLHAVEESLRATETAILSGDLGTLEPTTQKLIALQKSMAETGFPGCFSPGNEAGFSCSASHPTRLVPEWRAAMLRVLHLGRVQVALLEREQRFLRVLSNLRSEPDHYHPFGNPAMTPPHEGAPGCVPEALECRA